MRNGQSFMGISLGEVAVHPRMGGDLLKEVEEWLNRFRSAATKKDKEDSEKRGSARFRSALRQIERTIFDYCQYGGEGMFQRILISLGRAEALIAAAPRFREEAKGLRPIALRQPDGREVPLSAKWIKAADDQTDEFRIALALASIFEPEPKVGSIRRNLEAHRSQRTLYGMGGEGSRRRLDNRRFARQSCRHPHPSRDGCRTHGRQGPCLESQSACAAQCRVQLPRWLAG